MKLRIILTGCLSILWVAGTAAADLYIWTDEDGTVHMYNYGKPHHIKKYQKLKEYRPPKDNGRRSETDSALGPLINDRKKSGDTSDTTSAVEALLKGYSTRDEEETDWLEMIFKGYDLLKQDSNKKTPDNVEKEPKQLSPKPNQPQPPAKQPIEKGKGSNWLTVPPG